jgi:hypothetical protein
MIKAHPSRNTSPCAAKILRPLLLQPHPKLQIAKYTEGSFLKIRGDLAKQRIVMQLQCL